MFNTSTLLASLFWGSIGSGYCIYGKKQGATVALIGGLAMIAVSYFIPSSLWMSITSIALIAGMTALMKQGY